MASVQTKAAEGKPLLPDTSSAPVARNWKRIAVAAAAVAVAGAGAYSLLRTHDADTFDEFFAKMESMMDRSVDPCEDFYEYACGGWAKTAEIPATAGSIDTSFTVVQHANDRIIQTILADKPPTIGPFYDACLNATTTNVSVLQSHLAALDALSSKTDILAYAGQLYRSAGVASFLEFDVGVDPKNASVQVLTLVQGGWTLPTIEFYASPSNRALFTQYVSSWTSLLRWNASASDLWAFESALTAIAVPNSALRDPTATYNKMTPAALTSVAPYLQAYFKGAAIPLTAADPALLVMTPAFLTKQVALLNATSVATLRQYVGLRLVATIGRLLGEAPRRIDHAFAGVLGGLGDLPARDAFCRAETLASLPAFVGAAFQAAAFPDAVAAKTLIGDIEAAMTRLVATEPWLDDVTRSRSLEKIQAVRNFVGGPPTPPTTPVNMSHTDFVGNALAITQHEIRSRMAQIGGPSDPTRWDLGSFEVEAYYDPSANKMVFPAGILQPPIFSATKQPMIANYARIGVVMGHELSHGFDDMGRLFDAHGQLTSWWTDSVAATFNANAQCLKQQYDAFPIESIDANKTLLGHVDGALTLGENIADNGGVKLAYLAYAARQGLSTPMARKEGQLFFTSFAQGWWCQKRSDNLARVLMHTDAHSPGKWRLQGPLMNSPFFADAFQCPLGSFMNPKDKCVVW
ncbi:hypothetical protein SDRG_14893 [Saprolegnia diclina VS20]|uniref:Peptidase M13 C-terminal domain-containing protein n=1 Tax=Saprolegnia diclina (strain VS20) TaxID=1156394 RepID=T0RCE6_SAPDV|nr:hypothetical protein SDRG_14893 [Saprolegnia diclina VS20]EQC27272.1 hypothetical protein SDRG_14893 [Saprolegnia diclina VS20]|eukprot:XP_008619275.1 hypothetical protein SDRG_14893 [Saprolegnia diclina VS20]